MRRANTLTRTAAAACGACGLLSAGAAYAEAETISLAREDLVAQQGMNHSTEGLVMLGWMQLVISLAGTALVLGSLEMSRRAMGLTREALADQREAARHELRAYLGWLPPEVSVSSGELTITYGFKNIGKTPARNVRRWRFREAVKGFPDIVHMPPPKLEDFETGRHVPPESDLGMGFTWVHSTAIAKQFSDKATAIVVAIVYLYDDIYGATHAVTYSEIRSGKDLSFRRVNHGLNMGDPDFVAFLAEMNRRPRTATI